MVVVWAEVKVTAGTIVQWCRCARQTACRANESERGWIRAWDMSLALWDCSAATHPFLHTRRAMHVHLMHTYVQVLFHGLENSATFCYVCIRPLASAEGAKSAWVTVHYLGSYGSRARRPVYVYGWMDGC